MKCSRSDSRHILVLLRVTLCSEPNIFLYNWLKHYIFHSEVGGGGQDPPDPSPLGSATAYIGYMFINWVDMTWLTKMNDWEYCTTDKMCEKNISMHMTFVWSARWGRETPSETYCTTNNVTCIFLHACQHYSIYIYSKICLQGNLNIPEKVSLRPGPSSQVP